MKRWWIALFALLLLSMSMIPPAAAQSSTFLWSYGSSIPTQMTLTNAQLCDVGYGNRGIWPGTTCGDGTGFPTGTISVDLGANYTITSVELGWEYCCGNSVFSLSINGDSIGSFSPNNTSFNAPDYTYPDAFNASTVSISFSAFMFMDYISISYETASESNDLTRPLAPQDRTLAFQSIDTTLFGETVIANSAVIFSSKKNAMVSSVIDGTITLIEPLSPSKCYSLFTPAANDLNAGDVAAARDNCRVTIVSDLPGNAGEYEQLFSPINNPAPAYLIHIQGDDGREYLQIASDVGNYAYEGQRVSAGCWLGKALSVADGASNTVGQLLGFFDALSTLGDLIQLFGSPSQTIDALTAVWVLSGESYVDAWSEYTLDPSDQAPCNSPEKYKGCLGDSNLQDASQWQSSNGVGWLDNGGALMAAGSYIRATFNVDATRDPSLIVGGYAQPRAIVALTFGTASTPVNSILGAAEVELDAGDPDAGDFYTIEVRNAGDNPVRIDFICVVHGRTSGGSPTDPPQAATAVCFFTDASFEKGLDSWDASEDVDTTDGSLLLPDDATISQDIKLKAGTYKLTVIVQVWRAASYVADEDDISGGIDIEYAYPDETFVSMGSKTWSKFVHITQTYTSDIVIASDSDGTFTFRAQITAPPTGARGVQINSACLTQEGSGVTGPGDGIIEPTCGTIPTPTLEATQPGTWATWLWAQLNKFYRCELIKVINNIYVAVINFFRTATWSIRWSQAAVVRAGGFVNVTLYWLNGHLYNIAVGHVYVVAGSESGLTQSGDIGDVLLGGLKSVIDIFIELLQRVIDFVFYLLNLVFVLMLDIVVALVRIAIVLIGLIIAAIGNFFDIINALFFAWNNSTAAPIAGLPQCAVEPKENPVCVILWALENTIFSGRGFLFIPFMIAFGSAELLLWTISKFAKKTTDTANGG